MKEKITKKDIEKAKEVLLYEPYKTMIEKTVEGQKPLFFKLKNNKCVLIKQGGKTVGRIFTPSASGNDNINAIQICGFSEAFDLWGCGVYKGFKDIQLLFDNKMMRGEHHFDLYKCCRCYMDPCKCEDELSKLHQSMLDLFDNEATKNMIDKEDWAYKSFMMDYKNANPFRVKREWHLDSRIREKKRRR